MRVTLLLALCALLVGVYSQEDDPTLLFDECHNSVVPGQYCARASYTTCDAFSASFILGADTSRHAEEYEIQELIGASSTKLYCASSFGDSCDSCWSAKDVAIIDEDTTQVCFSFMISCRGLMGVHNTTDYPCVNLTGCSEDSTGCDDSTCGEHGRCGDNGACECDEFYFGSTCNVHIEDGEYSDDTGLTFSIEPIIGESCVLANTIAYPNSPTDVPLWILDPSYPPNLQSFLMHEVLINTTMITFEYTQLDVADKGITISISATIGQFGPAYLMYREYRIEIPEHCQHETTCEFSLDDLPILPPRPFTLAEGEEVFLKLYQVREEPLADMTLDITTEGTLNCIEKKAMCRPTLDNADNVLTITDDSKEWILVDSSCTSDADSGEGLYYFGFYCAEGGGDCTFTYNIVYHAIDTVVVDGDPSGDRPIYGAENYQYISFTFDERAVDFKLRVRIQTALVDSLEQHIYFTSAENGCATAENTGVPGRIDKTEPVINGEWAYSDYILEGIDPVEMGLVGGAVSVTLDVSSECPEGEICGAMILSVTVSHFEPESPSPTPSPVPESPVVSPVISPEPSSPSPVVVVSPIVSPSETLTVIPTTGSTGESTPDDGDESTVDDDDESSYEDDDGDDDDDNSNLYLLFLMGFGVILLCVCVIAVAVLVVLRLRKQKSLSANFDINDSLQDEDFEL